jgi:biopolymer transport protein ExbD
LNSQPVTLEELEETLTEVFSRRAVKNLFIRGDASLPYGDIFVLLDIAKRSGAGDIALLTKNELASSSDVAQVSR